MGIFSKNLSSRKNTGKKFALTCALFVSSVFYGISGASASSIGNYISAGINYGPQWWGSREKDLGISAHGRIGMNSLYLEFDNFRGLPTARLNISPFPGFEVGPIVTLRSPIEPDEEDTSTTTTTTAASTADTAKDKAVRTALAALKTSRGRTDATEIGAFVKIPFEIAGGSSFSVGAEGAIDIGDSSHDGYYLAGTADYGFHQGQFRFGIQVRGHYGSDKFNNYYYSLSAAEVQKMAETTYSTATKALTVSNATENKARNDALKKDLDTAGFTNLKELITFDDTKTTIADGAVYKASAAVGAGFGAVTGRAYGAFLFSDNVSIVATAGYTMHLSDISGTTLMKDFGTDSDFDVNVGLGVHF